MNAINPLRADLTDDEIARLLRPILAEAIEIGRRSTDVEHTVSGLVAEFFSSLNATQRRVAS